ncbi:hypothetical protein [Pendulispora albinea]|uniref:Uncharacterized protein n=1 Tax=Pendulispora albinea TaxID=2741071 RepID=A0ABZ2M5K2_9BACT
MSGIELVHDDDDEHAEASAQLRVGYRDLTLTVNGVPVADPQRALMACRGKVRDVQMFVFGDRVEFFMMVNFECEADTLRVPPEFVRALSGTDDV